MSRNVPLVDQWVKMPHSINLTDNLHSIKINYMVIIVLLILWLPGCYNYPSKMLLYPFSPPSPSWRVEEGPYKSTIFFHEIENAAIAIRKDCDRFYKKLSPGLISDKLFIGIGGKREVLEREDIVFKNIPAIRSVQLLRVEKGLIKIENILVMRDGCVLDIIFLAEENAFDHLENDFRRFLDGIDMEVIMK